MDGKKIVEEIKEEESFLLKLFQLEKIINKYKMQIIGFFVILILGILGYQVKNYMDEQNLIKTNEAYNKLLQNPNDKNSLEILKENKKLYNLYLLHYAKSVKDLEVVAQKTGIIGNIAKYEIAAIKGDKKSLENYSLTLNAVYKDLALFNLERLYLQDKNHKKAEEIVNQINDKEIKNMAQALLHYGIVK
ncbi:MAG: hypothetical protein DSY40_00860 [Nautilia sp.]|nr:MAG: hypothetical protein DSY40_00860 [Nautilia sp.]